MARNNYIIGGVAVVIIVFFGYLMFSRQAQIGAPVGENGAAEEMGPWKYDTFARCLTEKGMRMYGSATCSVCKRQKKLFGDSFRFVTEVECHPRYENAQTERCFERDISHTPTWIMEDAEGNEVERMGAGFQSLKNLSEFTGCALIEDEV